jgi:hypothetical protein
MRDPNKSMKQKKNEKPVSFVRSFFFFSFQKRREEEEKNEANARAHVHTTIEWDFFIMSHKADYKWRHGSFPSFTSTARKKKSFLNIKRIT